MLGLSKVKRFWAFLLAGLCLSWLVSCGGGGSTGNSSGEIEFWTMQLQPQFTSYFEEVIAKFKRENPGNKVRWVDVPWNAMESKIVAAIAANRVPDVVNLNPDFAAQLAAKNAWLELDSKYISNEQKNQYLPNMWAANSLDGKVFGIPWYLTTNVTIYNQELFKKAGIDKPPTTYQELAVVAKQIKEKTGKYALFTTLVPNDANDVLESFVQMGVELVDSQGKAAFNTPAGKAAFQYWVDSFKQGLLPQESLTQGHQQGIQLYQAGETAMLSAGAPFLKTIAKNAPNIAKISAVAPQITGSTGKKSVAVMNVVVPRGSKQPNQAAKFAAYITNSANQLAFAKASDVLPSQLTAIATYQKDLEATPNPTNLDRGKIVSAAQLSTTSVLIPPMKNLNILKQTIYENLQAAMQGKKSVDEAVAAAASTWNANGSGRS